MKNDELLEGMFKKTWIVVTISMFLVVINTLVDGVIIGQFLGEDCIADLGLVTPIVFFGNLTAILLSQGTLLLCSKYIGMADQNKLCEVFSTSCIFALLFLLPLIPLCIAFTPQIADFFSNNQEIYSSHIADYLYGYWLMLSLLCFLMMFSGLMRLDNDFKRGIISSLVLTVANLVFDYISVLYQGGMFGISLAGTLAGVLSFFILAGHFFKKNALLHFSFKYWKPQHIILVLKLVFSSTIATISVIIRTFILNWLLLFAAMSAAVAAFSIIQSLSMFFTLLIMAITATVSMIAGTLFGEGDRDGLKNLLRISMNLGLKISLLLVVIIMIFAEPLASMYISGQEEILNIAVRGLRFFAISLPLIMVVSSMAGYYISFGKVKENYSLVFAGECLFPVISALLLYNFIGVDGVWLCFFVGAFGGSIFILIFAWFNRNKINPGFKNILLLKENFGARTEDIFQASIHSMEEVIKISIAVALCIEELGKNIISYGFKPDGKNHLEIRLLNKNYGRILRIRDDCLPFDPVKWLEMNHSEDPTSNLGIRMVIGMAKDVQYLPMMGINQLIIKI